MTNKKNVLTEKMEELQESIIHIVKRIDEIKDLAQKNLNENIDKIKNLGELTQEKGKKYVDSVLGVIPFRNYYEKIKENDYTKLALTIKSDLEGKFNANIDEILNAFNISSTKDVKELSEKIEKIEKSIKKVQKDIKKIK